MKRIFQKIKGITLFVVGKIQKVLITIFLIVTYFIVFGVSLIFIAIFNRKLLWPKIKKTKTFWIDAKGYSPKIKDCLRQS